MVAALRYRSSQQPQFAARSIDTRFQCILVPAVSPFNLGAIGGVSLSAKGSGANVMSSAGLGVSYAGTDAVSIATPNVSVFPRSMLWVGSFVDAGANWLGFRLGHNSDNTGNKWQMFLTSGTQIQGYIRNNYQTIAQPTVSVPGGDSRNNTVMTVLLYSASQTDHRIYVQCKGGVASNTVATDVGSPSGAFNTIEPATNGVNKHSTYLLAYGQAPVSDAEITSLLFNPWQVLRRAPMRIWDATAAGGFLPAWASQRSRVIGAGVM